MKKITFAAVESFTGGMFSSKIVSIPGASTFFKGSLIAYNNEIKQKLGVDISDGVINAEVAKELSLKGKEFFDVDYCFAFTGNAGPKPIESKEIGLVFVALNGQVFELKLKGTRDEIREQSVQFAFNMFQKILKI